MASKVPDHEDTVKSDQEKYELLLCLHRYGRPKGTSYNIRIRANTTIPELYHRISGIVEEHLCDIELKLEGHVIEYNKPGTLKDNGILNKSTITVNYGSLDHHWFCKVVGPRYFSENALCPQPTICSFNSHHELAYHDAWQKIAEQREDAYHVVWDVFGFSHKIEEDIEDTSCSATLRLGSILHHIYHRDPGMNWDKVITEIRKKDDFLAQVIKNIVQ